MNENKIALWYAVIMGTLIAIEWVGVPPDDFPIWVFWTGIGPVLFGGVILLIVRTFEGFGLILDLLIGRR